MQAAAATAPSAPLSAAARRCVPPRPVAARSRPARPRRPAVCAAAVGGGDDPPSGPQAMAALLTGLAAASTAEGVQAALLPYLPQAMLADAEEEAEAGIGGAALPPPPPPLAVPPPPPLPPSQQQQQQQQQQHPQPQPHPQPSPSLPRALELMLRRPADEQPLDSFALRHLVLSRPRALAPLSALSASASRFVQRVGVRAASGERAVLTFTLARRGAGRRARRHAATATEGEASAYWFLVRVEGEQGGGAAAAAAPSPELAPETVVALQLAALGRGDLDAAYEFVSPVGRAVAGGGAASFARSLSSDARFRPLLRHGGWSSLRRTQSIARSFVEVVSVRPGGGQGRQDGGGGETAAVYAVIASLHPSSSSSSASPPSAAAAAEDDAGGSVGGSVGGGGGGAREERWLIDYFAPIRDKALLQALMVGRDAVE